METPQIVLPNLGKEQQKLLFINTKGAHSPDHMQFCRKVQST